MAPEKKGTKAVAGDKAKKGAMKKTPVDQKKVKKHFTSIKKRYAALLQPHAKIVSVDAIRRRAKARVNLRRFVRWPRYIVTQRQKRILSKRMKIPPSINQFREFTAPKDFAHHVVSFLKLYKPESNLAKKTRLEKAALAEHQEEKKTEKKKEEKKKEKKEAKPPRNLVFGLNEVVNAVEKKKAKLVVIAHDVDPIELVIYLPGLCHKLRIPYVIVKSKSRLGAVVGLKTCTCLCVCEVEKKDQDAFNKICTQAMNLFNDLFEERMRKWGGNRSSKQATEKMALAIKLQRESMRTLKASEEEEKSK